MHVNLAVRRYWTQQQNSKSGKNEFIGSSWRQPHLTIERITKTNDTDIGTSKLMKLYFNRLSNGWAVLRLDDVKEDWIRHEKATTMKKIDVKLRIRCHYCYFSKKMTLKHLPLVFVSIVKKVIPKVIPNCDPLKNGCCLGELWLDFSNKDWIGLPERYNIGRCIGKCQNIGFTRDSIDSKSMTEVAHHFLLKILSEQKKSNKKLCCSPQKFEPMALLYRNKKNFEMTTIQNAVITECGCA